MRIRQQFSTNLKVFILANGFSNKRLAEALGVTPSSVSQWLKGKGFPSPEILDQMCELLGVTPTDFFSSESISDKKESLNEFTVLELISNIQSRVLAFEHIPLQVLALVQKYPAGADWPQVMDEISSSVEVQNEIVLDCKKNRKNASMKM